MNKLKTNYSSPQVEEMTVRMESNILYSGNGTIGNLTNHTYDWDDSDWADVE